MVEREHLIAQHGEPVEVLGPLLVLDRRDRRLQPRDVRLERDADPVAEPALDAVEQHLQVPRRRRRDRQADRGDDDRRAVVAGHSVGEQLQPQRERARREAR